MPQSNESIMQLTHYQSQLVKRDLRKNYVINNVITRSKTRESVSMKAKRASLRSMHVSWLVNMLHESRNRVDSI